MLVGDNGYAVLDLLHCCQALREPVTLIARLRLDAALYAPAPPRQPGQNGRPALKGARRPSLKSLLDQDHVPWTVAAVAWYDGATRIVELTSQTAVWYRSGKLDFTQNLEEATDAITLGCRHSWLESEGFSLSAADADVQELPATLYH